jgi:mitochondrial intermediate peptidase
MLARNARASVSNTFRNIKRYRPREQRIRALASAATSPCPIEAELVSFFDHPSHTTSSPLAPTGLFGQSALTSPNSFRTLTRGTLLRAHLLTERIVRARENRAELFKAVKNLDRLSDLLCSVIDLSELIRNAHPDRKWLDSANTVYEELCEYMNVLNTSRGLYEVRSPLSSYMFHLIIYCRCLEMF